MTGIEMLKAVEEDDRARAEKAAKKHQAGDLRALREEKRIWRAKETEERKAAYKVALVNWEARCKDLLPRQCKPKKPTIKARPRTPVRFKPISNCRAPQDRQRAEQSDEDNEGTEYYETDNSE
ncbi:hypothetical protein FRC14_007589 [Serendipita sp. 396]|nr:hypothetical protein FRC14_007589 [Serendipita sp. 396]KAG8784696.1 hypothetical protein FRC15_002769 [Serendipita sp. 397]KAG8815049.1 hypothetical protein FRC19_001312 [Serendipita sp. 401]KAG9043267.1 hypothetical protein FS842_001867 [Serendipita sp. 407]